MLYKFSCPARFVSIVYPSNFKNLSIGLDAETLKKFQDFEEF